MAVYPERRSGRLTGKWIAEVTQNGERRRKRFATKHEGERWSDITKVTGSPPVDARALPEITHPFGEVVWEALKRHEGWEGDRDPSRHQRLMFAVDLIGADKPIEAITTADMDKLVADLKRRPGKEGGRLSAGTINRYLSLVSAVMTYARKRGYRAQTPDVPWQKEAGKRIHWITKEQEAALTAWIEREGRADEALTVRVLATTGLRWSEFESLGLSQVTDRWIKLDKTKTDTPRDVPIDPKLAEELMDMLRRGARPAYYTFRDTLKRALKNAGQNTGMSVHGLRHTTATRLVLAGVNLAVVQKFMGHSSINTTLKYTHVTEDALQEALGKISPHAGRSNILPFSPPQEVSVKSKEVEATPGIEPGYTVLQTDL